MKITIYDNNGKKSSDLNLNKEIFGIKPNLELMHRYLVLQKANSRYNLASTLTKGDVRGGGRKPFRQKGTGRARQGSTTNPHQIGGGIAHGPRGVRTFSLMMPKKMRRKALFGFLSKKFSDKKIFGLNILNVSKTNVLKSILNNIGFDRNLLIVISEKNSNENLIKSAKNLENIKVILASYLNPSDLTKYRNICFYGDSLSAVENIFLKK